MADIKYRRNEDKIIQEIKEYVDSTYLAHYETDSGRNVCDDWDDMGIAREAYISNIVKYVKRFGKKDGENPKDIMKIIHYSMFLLNEVRTKEENK
tara:strand:- start:272 stop:556 length:285 start_codon:yes stop_codon:yes gene_type:complete